MQLKKKKKNEFAHYVHPFKFYYDHQDQIKLNEDITNNLHPFYSERKQNNNHDH